MFCIVLWPSTVKGRCGSSVLLSGTGTTCVRAGDDFRRCVGGTPLDRTGQNRTGHPPLHHHTTGYRGCLVPWPFGHHSSSLQHSLHGTCAGRGLVGLVIRLAVKILHIGFTEDYLCSMRLAVHAPESEQV